MCTITSLTIESVEALIFLYFGRFFAKITAHISVISYVRKCHIAKKTAKSKELRPPFYLNNFLLEVL
jgi:hypothetical protein